MFIYVCWPVHIVSRVTITSQPQDIIFPLGKEEKAIFNILASGSQPIKYQWEKDGKPVVNEGRFKGADGQTLTITHPTEMDDGNYHCIVSNEFGEETSQEANLIIGKCLLQLTSCNK